MYPAGIAESIAELIYRVETLVARLKVPTMETLLKPILKNPHADSSNLQLLKAQSVSSRSNHHEKDSLSSVHITAYIYILTLY